MSNLITGEFAMQRTREDTFSGLIDLWAHGPSRVTEVGFG